MSALLGPVIVTGTDTGVGKTIVTAAISAAASARGLSVAVLKPCQTGIESGEETDAQTIARLAAPARLVTLASYPMPLAPTSAARVAGEPTIDLDGVVSRVKELAAEHGVVLIEGAGGLLVPMGTDGWTVADLAVALGAPAVVVARAGLGTLNHVALTRSVLAHSDVSDHLVIGAWPASPELVHRTNLRDLPPLAGAVPEGASGLSGEAFRTAAPDWLGPQLHGHFDAAAFVAAAR